jgi:hypothetical protein
MTSEDTIAENGQLAPGTDLEWLAKITWLVAPNVRVRLGTAGPSGTVPVERYAVIPNAERPRFLLPLESRRAARSALLSYNALRPPLTRGARAALATGAELGVAQLVFRDRLVVSVPADRTPSEWPSMLLREHLRRVLGVPDMVLAIGVRSPGPYTKPVLQAFSRNGRPRGYVKVGWNQVTGPLVRAEADFLQARRERPFHTILVPGLLHGGAWRELEISVTSPLPPGIRRLPDPSTPPPVETTREIAETGGLREGPLAESSYWYRLRRSVEDILPLDPAVTRPVRRHLLSVEERFGNTKLTFGSWHGDWTAWNVALLKGKVVAWDWEQAGHDVPLGFDIVHYLFQLPFAGKQARLEESVAFCRRRSVAPLLDLGVPPSVQPALISAYLLELFVRYYGAQLSGAGVNRRFYPAILELLASDLPD